MCMPKPNIYDTKTKTNKQKTSTIAELLKTTSGSIALAFLPHYTITEEKTLSLLTPPLNTLPTPSSFKL